MNLSSFQLSDGGSEEIELTPEEESNSFDDVLLVAYVDNNEAGDAKGTNVKVTIAGVQNGGLIRNSDAPTGMKNRIPPMNANAKEATPYTKVEETITPTLKDAKVVWFQILGNSAANGTAALLNAKDAPLESVRGQESGTLYVVGQTQTAPSMTDGKPDGKGSNAGKLFIVAYPGTKDKTDTTTQLAKSAGFSVAAIPVRVEVISSTPVAGERVLPSPNDPPDFADLLKDNYVFQWGVQYKLKPISDSDSLRDLDQALLREVVEAAPGSQAPPNQAEGDWGDAAVIFPDNNMFAYVIPKKKPNGDAITEAQARRSAAILAQRSIDGIIGEKKVIYRTVQLFVLGVTAPPLCGHSEVFFDQTAMRV